MSKPKALVVQQGGSSNEFYSTTYNTRKQAEKAVERHEEASYNAFVVDIPPELGIVLADFPGAEVAFNEVIKTVARKVIFL